MCGVLKIKCPNQEGSFLLPFLDSICNSVVGHKMHSFMDGYSSYNQDKMAKKTKKKQYLF
jgi:hypothetical protein